MKYLTLLFILINILIASAQVDYNLNYVSKNFVAYTFDDQGKVNYDEGEFVNVGHILSPTKDELRITTITYKPGNPEYSDFFFNWRFDMKGPDGEDSYLILEEGKTVGRVTFLYDDGQIWIFSGAREDGKFETFRRLVEVSFFEKSEEDIRQEKEYIPQTQRKN
tara:strand:+ start:266 stop:757 length:492 start_codon:yes stop_codon:yes gene_type:complete